MFLNGFGSIIIKSMEKWIKGELTDFSFELDNALDCDIESIEAPLTLTYSATLELTEEGVDFFSEMTGDVLDARVIE